MEIAAYARGLLSLLQAQTGGHGIRQASDSLAVTLEVGSLLGANRRELKSQDLSPVAAGINAGGFTVPAGEIWLVRAGSLYAYHAAAGGTILGASIVVSPAETSGSSFYASEAVNLMTAANEEFGIVIWEPRDLILNAGSMVSVYTIAVTGAGLRQASLRLYVERLVL